MWVFFCDWANEIRVQNFLPQHLAPRVTCEQFLFGHTCEFKILVAVVNSGLLQLSHVQHLVGFQLFPRFLALNAGLFPMSCYLQLSRLLVKGLPWLLLFIFASTNIKAEKKSLFFFFFFFLFSAMGERATPTSTKAERVIEIFGKSERETEPFLPPFSGLQPRVGEIESFGQG